MRTSKIKLIVSIAALILAALIPLYVKSPYYMDLLITTMMKAILAMTFIMMLRTGLVNLGLSAFWGLGAYISAVLVMKLHLSFWLSLPASALITGVIALGFGYVLIGSGSTGFTFVILSSVIGMLFTVVVGSIPGLGGYYGIPDIPPPNPIMIPFFPPIEFLSKGDFFYLALFLLVIVILIFKAFYSAWTGRAWTAIGLNPRLAASIGVNVFQFKMLSFVVASAICGLIGSFYAHYAGYLIPGTFGIWENINVQIYAILGGIGYPTLGPLLGSLVMTLFPELMRIANILAPVITGAVLILLMLFLPEGLLGLLQWRSVVVEKVDKIGKTIGSFLSIKRRVDRL